MHRVPVRLSGFLLTGVCLAALGIAGCGSSSPAASSSPYRYDPAQGKVAACAHAGKPINLPATFPRSFPFPEGTVITMTRPLPQKLTGVYGFVPSSGFASTVNFFKNQVKKAGFTVIDFQVDDPHDSEGTYRGNGRVGRWQVRSMPACPQAMTIAVSAGSAK